MYIGALVKDKSEKHLIMMQQNGLSRWTYWTVTYIFNYLLYVVIAVIISLLSLAFQMRLFTQVKWWATGEHVHLHVCFCSFLSLSLSLYLSLSLSLSLQTNAAVLILSLALWGHAQVALGFFFSNFFTRPRAAIIVGYLLVFTGVAVALLLEILQVETLGSFSGG